MDLINNYFSKLVFTRVEEKQGYVIYGAHAGGSFGGGYRRYILLFVPSHLAFKKKAKIFELAWKNLQTRFLRDSYNIPKQTWYPPSSLQNPSLRCTKRHKEYSNYESTNFPFEIILLHNKKNKSIYQYNNNITLAGAFETYNSVFNYVGNTNPLSYTYSSVGIESTSIPYGKDDDIEYL